jgi:MFS family permease
MIGIQPFSILRYRDYRHLTISSCLWFAVRWIETIVIAWMVLEMTDSPFWVGLVAAVRNAGWLLTPLTGIVADRISRRRLLLYSQILGTLLAALLLVLLLVKVLEIWQILILTLFRGINFALDFPVRNALIVDLVAPDEQLHAVSLNRAATDITAALGPIAGGALMALLGYAGAFWLILALSITNLVLMLYIGDSPRPAATGETIWSSLKEGFRLCCRDGTMMGVLGLACVANMFGFPLIHSLLPVFAKQVLRVGPAELGLLAGALGSGAFAGSLLLAWKGPWGEGTGSVRTCFLFWFVTMILFAMIPYFGFSLLLLVAIGSGQAVAMITTTAFLLNRAAPEMRGRIMGIRGLAIIPLFIGNLVGGLLTGWLGAPAALVIFGAAGILSTVWISSTLQACAATDPPGTLKKGL